MNAEFLPTIDKKSASEYFFRIGMALLVLRVLTTGLQLGIQYIIMGINPALYEKLIGGWWFPWALSIIPLYAVALPVFWIALPRQTEKYKAKTMSFGKLFGSVAACFPFMYIGSIIGTFVNELLANAGAVEPNSLQEIIDASPMWIIALCTVVIAPIGEELIFRKLLIDRLSPFGEVQAVIFSAVSFGLFHGNFHQFFYAALLGAVLGYVYVKTKNIWYSVIMHAVINFVGSVLSVWALRGIEKLMELYELDAEALAEAITPEILADILPIFVYSAVFTPLLIGGTIYVLVNAKKVKFDPARLKVEGGAAFALWSNPAVITAIAAMLATFILNFI